MRIRPTKQGPPLELPYFRSDDPESHDFVDLKRNPERIIELPELRLEPELERLVRELNASDGHFKTTGCSVWYDEEERPEGTLHYGSYLGFALDAWPFESQFSSMLTIHRFDQFSLGKPMFDTTYVRFEYLPTTWRVEGRQGWSLEFWTWGFANDRPRAREAWLHGISRFREFLTLEKAAWNTFLAEHPHPPDRRP